MLQIWEVPLVTPNMFTLSDAIALSPNTLTNTTPCQDGLPTLAQFLSSDRRFLYQRSQYLGSGGVLDMVPLDRKITVFKPTDQALMDELYVPTTPELLEMWSRFLFNGMLT